MRSIKELYELLLNSFKDKLLNYKDSWNYSICFQINTLLQHREINMEEFNALKNHFQKQYPRPWHKIFWNKDTEQLNLLFRFTNTTGTTGVYWFNPNMSTIRIKFLEGIIKKL